MGPQPSSGTPSVGRLHLSVVLAVSLALLAGVVDTAPDARAGTPSCKRPKSRTIAQNRFVRVFQVKRGGARKLYACRRSTGRSEALDEISGDDTFGSSYANVRLAGVYVAWESVAVSDEGCRAACPGGGSDGSVTNVEIYDARHARQRTVAAEPLGKALVLSRRGGVAWAQHSGAGSVEIRASVRRGDDRVLDRGNIDPRSLAIEITIISWKRGGVEYFARLR